MTDLLRLVFWEVTAGCNLDCIHCRRLDVARRMAPDDLSMKESFQLIDGIAELGRPILILSGGEPLIRPDIFAIARYGVDQGLKVCLATNGTLVSRKIAERIRDAGVTHCSVSLDGAKADTHDRFRGQPRAFERAIKGINKLRESGLQVQINTTVTRHNVAEMVDIYRLGVELGAVSFYVFMLVPVGCGLHIADAQMLTPQAYEAVLHRLYELSCEKKIHVKATCAPYYYRIIRQRAAAEGIELAYATDGMAAMTKGCLAGTAVCFVSHKGEVFPCGYLPLLAGNIRQQSFASIWNNSPLFRNLRDPTLLQGKCGSCDFREVCGGCRARAFSRSGNYLAEEPYCVYEPPAWVARPGCERQN